MRISRAIIFFTLAVTGFFFSCKTSTGNNNQAYAYSPVSKELYDTIAYMDSIFFTAFNMRSLDKVKALLSEDLEFYHDLGGVTNYNQNIDAFNRTFTSEREVRRELIKKSLEIYPIKDFGAVETGIHRFYVTEKGQQEKLSSEAKFAHVWQKKDEKWRITRIISYGHHEYLK